MSLLLIFALFFAHVGATGMSSTDDSGDAEALFQSTMRVTHSLDKEADSKTENNNALLEIVQLLEMKRAHRQKRQQQLLDERRWQKDNNHLGTSENDIFYNDPPLLDTRLMAFRNWTKYELARLPAQHYQASSEPGAWDHACHDPKAVSAIQSASRKIPRHMHFVLFLERGQWINKTHPSQLISKDSREYVALSGSEQLIIENVRYTMAAHGMDSVHFLDDDACKHATSKWSKRFQEVYDDEADLRFKSDICRVAALYWEGGYHFDDDMVTYNPVSLDDEVEFATAVGVTNKSFFQSFVAVQPCSQVLARNIELLIQARTQPVPKFLVDALDKEDNLLGPITMKLAWKEFKPRHTKLLREIKYDPTGEYGKQPFRGLDKNGADYSCEFEVVDESTKKIHFCSRF
mmetsp:Transcript_71505/g.125118  ORF Transcript_71505/g.125118 Transcript_71505/m.125118 type:complete len:404 (+) Transcript_71505:82-1293(+)